MNRSRFAAQRLGQMVPILFGVSIIVFLLIHLVPGDPARTLLGPQATAEQVTALQDQLGLNRPLLDQYVDTVGGVITGDLGQSLTYDQPVSSLLGNRWAPTAWLIAYATVLVVLLTVPLALLAARRPGGVADGIVRTVALVGLGMPSFWVGLLLILGLGLRADLFPVSGYGEGFFGHLHSMFLPALTVALSMAPITIRSLRASLIDVFDSGYVLAALAKGLGQRRIMFVYALRNAVLPVVTVLGVNLGWLVGNTLVIEEIFVIPGMGSMMIQAIVSRDFPVVQVLAMMFAFAVILISLSTDLVRASLDPRVQLG